MYVQAHTCDNTLSLPNYWEGVQQPLRSSGFRLSSPRHSKAQNEAMERRCKEVTALCTQPCRSVNKPCYSRSENSSVCNAMQSRAKQSRAEQSKAKQSKAKQSKAKQSKAKQTMSLYTCLPCRPKAQAQALERYCRQAPLLSYGECIASCLISVASCAFIQLAASL